MEQPKINLLFKKKTVIRIIFVREQENQRKKHVTDQKHENEQQQTQLRMETLFPH